MRVPRCPACGVKFAHSISTDRCTKCLLPDEVIAAGSVAVERWAKAHGFRRTRPSTSNKLRKKHGRQHV